MAAGVLPQNEDPYSTLVNSSGHAAHMDGNNLFSVLSVALWKFTLNKSTLKGSERKALFFTSEAQTQVLFMACAFCLSVWPGRIPLQNPE